jgi:hypothetical protein
MHVILMLVIATAAQTSFAEDAVRIDLPTISIRGKPEAFRILELPDPISGDRKRLLTEDAARLVRMVLNGRMAEAAQVGFTPPEVDVLFRALQPIIDSSPMYMVYPEITRQIEDSAAYVQLHDRIFTSPEYQSIRKHTSKGALTKLNWALRSFIGEWILVQNMTRVQPDSLNSLATLFATLHVQIVAVGLKHVDLAEAFQSDVIESLMQNFGGRSLLEKLAETVTSSDFAEGFERLQTQALRRWTDRIPEIFIPMAVAIPVYVTLAFLPHAPNVGTMLLVGTIETKLLGTSIISAIQQRGRRRRADRVSRRLLASCQELLHPTEVELGNFRNL